MTPVEEVVAGFISRLFPDFATPKRVACPSVAQERALLDALDAALHEKHWRLEVINLRPAPGQRLDAVTERLALPLTQRTVEDLHLRTVLAVVGMDLLEGEANEAPTYPFRSRFQFDRDYLWLFVGRDRQRLNRLFTSYRLPLYRAASDITPAPWR